ncbi:MAG: head GIN domain-containing protein [Bacteroidales bacterium]|nr:head GIN domain-containing protein [Bacteroidales bacterium]
MSVAFIMTMGACSLIDSIKGSGNIVAEVHDLSGFDAIKAGGASDVQITLNNYWHVELITDDNLHEYVELSVENGTLRIKNREMVNLRPTEKVLIRVVMPALNEIAASGASTIIVESEIVQSDLSVSASGSSDVYLQVSLDNLAVRCSGSSDIYISGYSRYAKVSASGSSDFRGKEFTCDEAEVYLSGSSDMYAIIREEVRGSLSGSSDLHISGSPVIKVRTSGSSDIRNF